MIFIAEITLYLATAYEALFGWEIIIYINGIKGITRFVGATLSLFVVKVVVIFFKKLLLFTQVFTTNVFGIDILYKRSKIFEELKLNIFNSHPSVENEQS